MGERLKFSQKEVVALKIKEVIEKTELTDRAIRLYMENGLIDPYCKEAYNGRKNIDFSQQDVEQLKNIALLRKAGFSIAEIKELQYGGENAKYTFNEFINKIEKDIERNTQIFQMLKVLKNEEKISIENICKTLSSSVTDKKVPDEDLKPDLKEQAKKVGQIIFSLITIIFSGFCFFFDFFYFKFIEFYSFSFYVDTYFIHFIPLIQFLAALALLGLSIFTLKKINNKRTKRATKCMLIVCLIAYLLWPLWLISNMARPIVYSQTNNPENYLELDDIVAARQDDIYTIFPAKIPFAVTGRISGYPEEFPKTVKYFYRYDRYSDDILAEWSLPDEEYEKAKERVFKNKEQIRDKEKKGDWICLYFDNEKFVDDESNKYGYYSHLIFAYNDKNNTVRYIKSSGEEFCTPYFEELDW